jgi:hypothetical protein
MCKDLCDDANCNEPKCSDINDSLGCIPFGWNKGKKANKRNIGDKFLWYEDEQRYPKFAQTLKKIALHRYPIELCPCCNYSKTSKLA